MPLSTRTRKKAMIEAMKSSLGNVSVATDTVGISRSIHYKWMKSDEKYRKLIKDNLERSHDFVEAALFKRIGAGDTTAIIFFLKTRAKHRGYGQTRLNLNDKAPRNDLESKTNEELMVMINKK